MNYSLLCQFINYVSSYDDNYTQAMKRVQAHQQYSQFENYASSSGHLSVFPILILIVLLVLVIVAILVIKETNLFFGSSLKNHLSPFFPDITSGYSFVSFQIYGMKTTINFFGDDQDENSCTCLTVDFLNKGIEANKNRNMSVSGNDRRRFYKIFHVIIEEGGLFDLDKCVNVNALKKRMKVSTDDPLLKKKLVSDTKFLHTMMELYSAVKSDNVECTLERDCLRIRCPFFLSDPELIKKFSIAAIKLLNVSLELTAQAGIKLAISASPQELQDKFSKQMTDKLLLALSTDASSENSSEFSRSNSEWDIEEDLLNWAYSGNDDSQRANESNERGAEEGRAWRDAGSVGRDRSDSSEGFGGGFDESFNGNYNDNMNDNSNENSNDNLKDNFNGNSNETSNDNFHVNSNDNSDENSNGNPGSSDSGTENSADSQKENNAEAGYGTRTHVHIDADGDGEF